MLPEVLSFEDLERPDGLVNLPGKCFAVQFRDFTIQPYLYPAIILGRQGPHLVERVELFLYLLQATEISLKLAEELLSAVADLSLVKRL